MHTSFSPHKGRVAFHYTGCIGH